jgi:uncharacterized membrane protein YkvA (DUF1232 family)
MSMSEQKQNDSEENEMNAANQSLVVDKGDLNFWQEFWSQFRLVWFLMRDRDVPLYLKVLPLLAVIYAIWPIDLLPGIILDDLTALLVAGKIFIELSPPQIVARHLQLMHGWKQKETAVAPDNHPEDDPNIVDSIVIRPDDK